MVNEKRGFDGLRQLIVQVMIGIMSFFQTVLTLILAIIAFKVYQDPNFWEEANGVKIVRITVALHIALLILKKRFKQMS